MVINVVAAAKLTQWSHVHIVLAERTTSETCSATSLEMRQPLSDCLQQITMLSGNLRCHGDHLLNYLRPLPCDISLTPLRSLAFGLYGGCAQPAQLALSATSACPCILLAHQRGAQGMAPPWSPRRSHKACTAGRLAIWCRSSPLLPGHHYASAAALVMVSCVERHCHTWHKVV